MLYTCLVQCCNSTALKSTKDLTFHRIPQDLKRRKEWLAACNRTDLCNKPWEFFKHKYVCNKHFEKWMYGVRCLQKFAHPTLNLTPDLQDICTQTYISIKCSDPTPCIKELPGEADGLKSQTEMEEFVHCTGHLEVKKENDNSNIEKEVQSDELEPKDEKAQDFVSEDFQMSTVSEQESEEDTSEINVYDVVKMQIG
ncbi:hypothetical protein PYW08_003283 [Mythimna loreyi]|uniref:Uncharacterized protein n=1 Tax=Mythimna loreyi TaxID=667449 RepID=A0ACC2QSZ4_9NEOP|nr:hypothetical protein PYW08_003283 [Mythimna loreyi]